MSRLLTTCNLLQICLVKCLFNPFSQHLFSVSLIPLVFYFISHLFNTLTSLMTSVNLLSTDSCCLHQLAAGRSNKVCMWSGEPFRLPSISQCTVQLINSVRVIRPGAKQHQKLDNYCKIEELVQECGSAAVVQDGCHLSLKKMENGEDKLFKFIVQDLNKKWCHFC